MIEILIDVYKDGTLVKELVRDREDDWNVSDRRKYDAKGHIDITVPFNANITKSSFTLNDLSEIVQEAQLRNVKEVDVRCKYRILLTNDDWGRVEKDGFNIRDVSYTITLLSYTTLDEKVIELDDTHWSVFAGHLQRQVHASILSKIGELRPRSLVITRRT